MHTDHQFLFALGFPSAKQIGSGAEADVYAVSEDRVLRLLKPGGKLGMLESRVELLSEVRSGSMHLPFETPCVESVLAVGGRCGTLEQRLPGEPLTSALRQYRGQSREKLLRAWLDVSTRISDIRIEREWYGELAESDLREYPTFHSYWIQSWLRERGLSEFLASAELMMAAYWFFARDDPELDRWCRSTLDSLSDHSG